MGDVVMKMDGDSAKMVDAFLKVENRSQILEQKLARVAAKQQALNSTGRSVKGIGRAASGANDKFKITNELLSKVTSYAGSFTALAAGIGLVTKALSEANQEAEDGAESMEGRLSTLKRLVQVSGGSDKEFDRLKNMSDQIALREGIDLEKSDRLIFSAKSFGLLDKVDFAASTAAFTDDPEILLASANKFQKAFGKKEAGTVEQLFNKFQSAANTSELDVESIAQASVAAAGSFSQIGASDEELLAVMSVLSSAFKSPEVAATRASSFASVAFKEGFKKDGFFGSMEKFQNMPKKDLDDLLGKNKEFAQFIGPAIENLPAIKKAFNQTLLDQSLTGTSDSVISQQISVANKKFGRLRDKQRSDVQLDLSKARDSDQEFRKQEIQNLTRSEMLDKGIGKLDRFFLNSSLSIHKFFGSSSEDLKNISKKNIELIENRRSRGFFIPKPVADFTTVDFNAPRSTQPFLQSPVLEKAFTENLNKTEPVTEEMIQEMRVNAQIQKQSLIIQQQMLQEMKSNNNVSTGAVRSR